MIEINWNGNEKELATIQAAEAMARDLMKKGYGSDIWVDNKLHQTIMFNARTGEKVLFIYTQDGNVGIKI